jgi:hypothetical protein
VLLPSDVTDGRRSDVCKYPVQRPRHLGELEGLDEVSRVADLPAPAAAHEAPELLLQGPSSPRSLLLERAERAKVSVSLDDRFHRGGAESADQFLFEVCDARVETQSLQIGASQVGAEARSFETPSELAFLCGVIEAGKLEVEPVRAKPIQEASGGLGAPDRHDGDALRAEIPTTALSERFDRVPVAVSFDEHDGTRVDACDRRV